MAAESQILRTKLYPPRLPEIVVRERLLVELEKASSSKLTSIVAGAGYGKSTLAAEFFENKRQPFVWYQLEKTDSDLSVFLSYLVAGLRSIRPGFGANTLSHLDIATNVGEQSRAILSTFIGELDEITLEDLFIALDDFHLVNESAQITEAMDFLLGHTLPNLHFVILSRSALSFDLAELKARRELLELSEGNLRFTQKETAMLFRQVLPMPLSEEDIAALSETTEGWISGLVLFYLALKNREGNEVSRAIRESGLSLPDVFAYLSTATYKNQPQAVRDFIERTSVLSRMNPKFCDELLGIDDSHGILSYLMSERLFTIPLDDQGNWYRYHHGLRVFLKRALLDTLSTDDVRDLHLRAAALWENYAEPEEALYHYMEADDYERAAQALEGISLQLMQANRISFLEGEINRLPEEVLRKHPVLMLTGTQIAGMFGDYARVLDGARVAAEAFEESGNAEERTFSILRLALGYIALGKFQDALETISRARKMLPADSPFMCLVIAAEGSLSVAAGRAGEADSLIEETLTKADEIDDTVIKMLAISYCGIALVWQGRFNRAIELFHDVDRLFEITGMVTSAWPLFLGLISRAYVYLDRLEEAVETANKAIYLGETNGIPPMVLLGRAARAVAWAYLHERDKALEDAAIAAKNREPYGPGPLAIYTESYLGEAFGLTGDSATALEHLQAASQMGAGYGDFRYLIKLSQIAFSARTLGLERTGEEVRGIMSIVEDSGARQVLSLAYSLLFTLKVAGDMHDEAREILDEYVSEFGEDIILRCDSTDIEYLLPFFTDLFAEGKHLEFMERLYGIGGAKSVPWLKRLEKSSNRRVAERASGLMTMLAHQAVVPLGIEMLGPFRATRGGREISARDWKSRKAQTTLKYLAANRDKGAIPRDVLIELLWPEAPLESAQKNLNAALSSLRRILEPEMSRGNSSYVVSDGDSVRLHLGAGGWTDLDLFREKSVQAGKAKESGDFDLYFHALKEAVELYKGDLCSEDLYEGWCSLEREVLKNDYIMLLANLSTEHLRRGEAEEAMARLEQAIAKDPGREEFCRRQMTICSQAGDRAGVEKAFRRCVSYLKDNYDVSPSPETTGLYKRLRA
jgi:LuxR family transcriptional regulator, maltose regulon positive regulatory protein